MRKKVRLGQKLLFICITGLLLSLLSGCQKSAEDLTDSQIKTEPLEITESLETTEKETITEELKIKAKSAAEHLLVVWADYLRVLDRAYASELWALGYVQDYLESGDWADLKKARAACIASARYLSELSMTEDDLSEEEYLYLANMGIDTGYQSLTFASAADTVEGAHSFIRNRMLENLEYHIFYKEIVENLKDEIAVERDAVFCMCRYQCVETNYLLLSLKDYIHAEDEWASILDTYQILSVGAEEWLDTELDLKTAADACLDEYEENLLKQSDVLSGLNAELYNMMQIIQKEDSKALAESAYSMVNLPDFLPMPTWYDPGKTGYLSFIQNEKEEISYPESGEELFDADYGVYIQIQEISEEEIVDYLAAAEPFADQIWKGEEAAVWYISMPEYQVKIDWKEDRTATFLFIGEDISFAPSWYIANSKNFEE